MFLLYFQVFVCGSRGPGTQWASQEQTAKTLWGLQVGATHKHRVYEHRSRSDDAAKGTLGPLVRANSKETLHEANGRETLHQANARETPHEANSKETPL